MGRSVFWVMYVNPYDPISMCSGFTCEYSIPSTLDFRLYIQALQVTVFIGVRVGACHSKIRWVRTVEPEGEGQVFRVLWQLCHTYHHSTLVSRYLAIHLWYVPCFCYKSFSIHVLVHLQYKKTTAAVFPQKQTGFFIDMFLNVSSCMKPENTWIHGKVLIFVFPISPRLRATKHIIIPNLRSFVYSWFFYPIWPKGHVRFWRPLSVRPSVRKLFTFWIFIYFKSIHFKKYI